MEAMKPTKRAAAVKPRDAAKAPSQKAFIRAVVSFTAIETGKSILQIERMLRNGRIGKFRNITLAR